MWKILILIGLSLTACTDGQQEMDWSDVSAFNQENGCAGKATAPILPKSKYLPAGYEGYGDEIIDPCMLQWARKGNWLGQYAPSQGVLDHVRAKFNAMNAAAPSKYTLVSGYRSYDSQVSTFQSWVNKCKANTPGLSDDAAVNCAWQFSAKPGTSEHQLGVTYDITAWGLEPFNLPNEASPFGLSAPGKWLRDHAHKYGFVMSYPWGLEPLHCYDPEPWHWRFVGKALATYLFEESQKRGAPYTIEHLFRESFGDPSQVTECPKTQTKYNYNKGSTGTNPDVNPSACKESCGHWTTCLGNNQACVKGQVVACNGGCEAKSLGTHDVCRSSTLCKPIWADYTTCVLGNSAACFSGAVRGCQSSCQAQAKGEHDICE
jgi:hypothetical protein